MKGREQTSQEEKRKEDESAKLREKQKAVITEKNPEELLIKLRRVFHVSCGGRGQVCQILLKGQE